MNASTRLRPFGLALLLLALALPARAQRYGEAPRAVMQSTLVLGMGDAAVAFPTHQSAFVYNPAHVAALRLPRAQVQLIGYRTTFSTNVFDQYDFYDTELEPALDRGLDNLSDDELEALYDHTFALGRQNTRLNADVLLPTLMVRTGGAAFGLGAFAHSDVRYRFDDAGAGVPLVDFAARADVVGAAVFGLDLGAYSAFPLRLGLTGKYVQRYLSLKHKPLDALDVDEDLYLLRGTAATFDAGLLYEPAFLRLPGRFTLGAAWYDLGASAFGYGFSENLTGNAPLEQDRLDEEIALAEARYRLAPSYRLGLAYAFSPNTPFDAFDETALALDYVGYGDGASDQAFLAHLHAGLQVHLLSFLAVRAGISQGYTTLGAGLKLGFVTVDYAYYGVEEGRFPGQLARWNHTLQVVLRNF